MMADQVDVSVAIVSYNTKDLVLDCLRTVFEETRSVSFEVILVDNDSRDGSIPAVRTQYPAVRVIENDENVGFSKAVNQALAVSMGRHIVLLNSDTRVRHRALDKMVAYLDAHQDVGAVSCQQWTEDGQLYQSCFPFPSIRDHLRYAAFFQRVAPHAQAAMAAALAIDCRVTQDVDWINGACLMVRRTLMEQCGGLDEGFFMYFEDVDLCRGIHHRGFRIRHLAEAEIVHLLGRSGERDRARLNLEWEYSRIRYVEKHFPLVKRWIMKGWIAAGAGVRMLRALVRTDAVSRAEGLRPHLSVWRRLWRKGRTAEARVIAGTHTRRSTRAA